MLESGRRKSLYEQATEMGKKSPKMMFVCVWVRGGGDLSTDSTLLGLGKTLSFSFILPVLSAIFFTGCLQKFPAILVDLGGGEECHGRLHCFSVHLLYVSIP